MSPATISNTDVLSMIITNSTIYFPGFRHTIQAHTVRLSGPWRMSGFVVWRSAHNVLRSGHQNRAELKRAMLWCWTPMTFSNPERLSMYMSIYWKVEQHFVLVIVRGDSWCGNGWAYECPSLHDGWRLLHFLKCNSKQDYSSPKEKDFCLNGRKTQEVREMVMMLNEL